LSPTDNLGRHTTYYRLSTSFPLLTILLTSILWALCYPPFPLGLLGFAVFVPAFLATTSLTPGRAFRLWFLGGLAYNTLMYWWIWHVMKVGPAFVVGFGLLLLIAFLSLFNGFLGWAFARAHHASSPSKRRFLLLTFPFAWGGLEAARAVGEMSFPWNNLGYTLGSYPTLIQSASIWGIYGLSTLMVAVNLLLFQGVRRGFTSHSEERPQIAWNKSALPWFLLGLAVPVLLTVHGFMRLGGKEETLSPRLDISLVQPSIPQTKKWNEDYFSEVIRKTFRVMEGPSGDLAPLRGTDLIVLAETAVPDFLRARPALSDSLQALATRTGASLLVGALDVVSNRQPWREYDFYNSGFLYEPGADEARQYSKLRLVPFSEKLPFDGVFPVLNYVNLGEGDFSSGDGHRVWSSGATAWSPSICYEVIYPSFARDAKAAGAKLLVNITNDGWFGRSNGPYQHANIARFRAVETGMPVARCANNGVSVFYDARGRTLGETALMDSVVLRRSIPVPDLTTPYSQFGGTLDGLFLLVLPIWIILALFAKTSKPQGFGTQGSSDGLTLTS
jgi:apolipoprotein N-acyltransferase